VSASEGFITGGQELKITGMALNGTGAVVTVDGVDCPVKSNTATEIVCTTGLKAAVSFLGL